MPSDQLQTTSEKLDKDRVKLRVEVPEESLSSAIDAVYRRWSKEIKVPGFRKGKVPRQIIDSKVGPEAIREEALRDALPDFYREALQAEGLEPIAAPEIDVVAFEPGTPVVFEATVDVRPEITLPDPSTVRVEAPSSEVTETDIADQLDRLRDRFAELETVSREVRRGDHVLIDLNGYRHGEPVEGASAPDYLYEVGSQSGPPRLDDELVGNRPGAIIKFNDEMPPGGPDAGEEISFTVLLKEVKTKKLPALDDEFAKTVGEFESLDELRADLKERLVDVKKRMAEEELRVNVLSAYLDASDLDAPERLVEDEFNHRLSHLQEDLKRAGLSLDDYTRQAGITELEVRRDLRTGATRAVKAELLLEQLAREQDVEVGEEDIGREIAIAAAQSGQDPKEVAQQIVESGRLSALAADIMRRKALDFLVQNVNVIGRSDDEEEEQAD